MFFNKKFYIVLLLETNNVIIIPNKALNGNEIKIDNYCFGKKVESILGITFEKDDAELIKYSYEVKGNNKLLYVVHGDYPYIDVLPCDYIAEDDTNYCIRLFKKLTLFPRNRVFKKIEDAILYQNELIQEKDKLQTTITTNNDCPIYITTNDSHLINGVEKKGKKRSK